ncbi:unnamed protein product [Candidula unifasciata]|uniref:C-type lectin domain-containing protein n=1 Tax=Candidula unifasciata TaxID=100452 RepID=A0A8S3ZI83_9EUPU|nr:unnamed protein product [Candidula unifasciata]
MKVVLCLAMIVPSALADCPIGWPQFGDLCFSFNPEPVSWITAASFCHTLGARLVEITSKEKQDWIAQQMKAKPFFTEAWIGGSRRYSDWAWMADSKPIKSYTNWAPKKQDNKQGANKCLLVASRLGYKWTNVNCLAVKEFICEKRLPW